MSDSASHACIIEAIAGIQTILLEIIDVNPQGITEYDLLNELAEHNVSLFTDDYFKSTLGLFQRHFLLFHCLYLLRNKLRTELRGDLEIHCLCVRRAPYIDTQSNYPALHDPLADYYLDLANLKSTGESDVLRLLNSFWQRFAGEDQREAALAVMQLTSPASYDDIRQQYRRLDRKSVV